MSTKKTIQINPELFTTNKTRKKKEKQIKSKPLIKTNSLKKALLKRIKHHAKSREKQHEQQQNTLSKEEEFSNDFHSHLDYLNNVQKKNKTLKKQKALTNNHNIDANVFLPPELDNLNDVSSQISTMARSSSPLETPPYGCLKNGTKPTWREWKKNTQKNYSFHTPEIDTSIDDNFNHELQSSFSLNKVDKVDNIDKQLDTSDLVSNRSERETKLENLRNKIKNDEVKEKKKKNKIKQTISTLKKRTIKIENRYGKNKNKVSVLVKNSATRKNIQKEHNKLKQHTINDVKQYLKKHYLLKVGSNAPNDVLRKMYETVHLCGDIKNINKNNLVHNYLNDENNNEFI